MYLEASKQAYLRKENAEPETLNPNNRNYFNRVQNRLGIY